MEIVPTRVFPYGVVVATDEATLAVVDEAEETIVFDLEPRAKPLFS